MAGHVDDVIEGLRAIWAITKLALPHAVEEPQNCPWLTAMVAGLAPGDVLASFSSESNICSHDTAGGQHVLREGCG